MAIPLNNFQQGGTVSVSSEDEDDSSIDSRSSIDYDDLDLDNAFSYFIRRHGRLFHSHGISLYPLPVDSQEQQRQIVQHVVLRKAITANYVGPVPEILAATPERRKCVLDLGTGSGQWPTEMALEFPHVLFHGLDIVPIQSICSLPNVRYVQQDINHWPRSEWNDNSVDLVHARDVWLGIPDYRVVVREMARIIRPGGLFLSCEWGIYCAFHPCYDHLIPSVHAPGAYYFLETIAECMRRRGILSPASLIPIYLHESRRFNMINPEMYHIPIGPWHPDPLWKRIGRAFRAGLVRVMEAWKPILRESGYSEVEVEVMCRNYLHDLRTVKGMVSHYHAVYASKC